MRLARFSHEDAAVEECLLGEIHQRKGTSGTAGQSAGDSPLAIVRPIGQTTGLRSGRPIVVGKLSWFVE